MKLNNIKIKRLFSGHYCDNNKLLSIVKFPSHKLKE